VAEWPVRAVVCPVLIGREPALQVLDGLVSEVRAGQGRTLLVAGEAGIGKSRFVAEAAGPRSGLVLLEGHCFEPDRALPYAPLLDLLRSLLLLRPPEEIADWLGPTAPELVKLVPELAAVLPDVVPTATQEPEQDKRRRFHALVGFFARVAARGPVLISIEDLHWCDDTSLEFLLALARRIPTLPALLLLTFRSDEIHPELRHLLAELDRGRLATEVMLDRLPRAGVDAMLQAIFQLGRPARADLLDAIHGLTDGNPFFVEEVLKSLQTSGGIFYAGGGWDRRPLDELQIPRSVQDAVQRRVYHLGPTARELLTVAAVAGRRFDFALLQAVTGRAEGEFLVAVKELTAAQLVVEVSAEQFAFRHALTRQAVYADLLVLERRALHRQIAEALERLTAGAPDARLADLALHYFAAADWPKALDYGQRAGFQALALDAPRAAVAHFTWAIEAAERQGQSAPLDVLRSRGAAYETLGNFDAALADSEQGLAVARARGERPAEWQLLLDLGLLWMSRDYDRAVDHLETALALARELGEARLVAPSLNRLGNAWANVGRTVEAIRAHEEALAYYRATDDRPGMAETSGVLGVANTMHGDHIAAVASYGRAIELYRDLGDNRGLAISLAQRGNDGGPSMAEPNYGALRTRAESERDAAEALRLARQIDWPSVQAFAAWTIAAGLGGFGDFDAALSHLDEAHRIATEIGHRQWLAAVHWARCRTHLCLLDPDGAIEAGEAAIPLARDLRSAWWVNLSTTYLTLAYLARGDAERVESLLAETPAPGHHPRNSLERHLAWAKGRLRLETGQVDEALAIAERLLASAPGDGGGQPIPALHQLKAEALLALHRPEEAAAALEAAADGAAQRQELARLWHVRGLLARTYGRLRRAGDADRENRAARALIDDLAATIGDPSRRDRFRQAALATLPDLAPAQPAGAADDPLASLTRREREVARQIALGKSNREIGVALFIGERTVETHVASIFAKLGCGSRAQVAALVGQPEGSARSSGRRPVVTGPG
jgi:DNA-binding CsgD family transcriptional regulator